MIISHPIKWENIITEINIYLAMHCTTFLKKLAKHSGANIQKIN